MIISHEHRFIFVKTAKTASTSLQVELERICGPDDVITPIDPPVSGYTSRNCDTAVADLRDAARTMDLGLPKWFEVGLDHEEAANLLSHLGGRTIRSLYPQHWAEYLTFCVERNPWDKLVSYFHQLRADEPDLEFRTFVAFGLGWLSGASHWADESGTPIVDRVLRWEHLDEDVGDLLSSIGVDWHGFVRSRAKGGYRPRDDDYRPYYDEETRELVATAQREVIELFGYEF